MEALIGKHADKIKMITPQDGAHYFFAYYDMRATQGEHSRHLAHRVSFMDRLPTADDICQLGTLENGTFVPFAETTAWNFQQGAMLQYHPARKDTVYYNVRENGRFMTVTHDLITGAKTYADRATACISPDGKWGLGVNFGKIYDFRPGYGYAGDENPQRYMDAPAEDGVFLVDMETGISWQLLAYDAMRAIADFDDDQKILVNHITFNTTSDRYVMLVRNFKRPGEKGGWLTSMVIGDLKGNMHTVLSKTMVSHYNWMDAENILVYCAVAPDHKGVFRINTTTGEWEEYRMAYNDGKGNRDIHCNLSPDGSYFIGDGYPIEGYRALMAYSMKTGRSEQLFAARTDIPAIIDVRCDLHARFVWDGKYISFDTTHNGRREIAVLPSDVLNF
ncbi:MAG: hypothetical protein IJW99_09160 [Clostridia bacterium]|nr:hypothetical protein [Clostridia bacterium]